LSQWRSQGLESEGDKLSAKGAKNLGGSGGMPPGKISKFRAYETPFCAFWGEILQNSEDYNIIKYTKNITF
jgi:hypothetical protein